MEHQGTGLQRFFKFFLSECNSLVVVVRTDNIKFQAVTHEPSYCLLISRQFSIVAQTLASNEFDVLQSEVGAQAVGVLTE